MTVKIAHISDVHWERRSPDVSDRLTAAIRKESPNIIVFTGDLVDNPWHLEKAKRWLLGLCDECKVSSNTHLLVVPGNHDYRALGNFGFRPLTGLAFRRCFRSWLRRRLLFFPDLNVTFFRIDSNPLALGFARGRVGGHELKKLADELERFPESERNQIRGSTKIALVHHHPLPVPYEGADTFLMLADAQRLIQFLAENRIDVVLHGHKHRAPYSLLSLGTCVTGNRVIEVLGAGTAAAGGTDREARGHNFNLVCIEPKGLRYVRQFFARPGEDFIETPGPGFPTESCELAYQRALDIGYRYRSIHWDLDINVDGDRFNQLTYGGVAAVAGKELAAISPPAYEIGTGYFSNVWLDGSKTDPGVVLKVLHKEPRRVEFQITFSKTPTEAKPVKFSIQTYDLNAFTLDISEFQKKFPTRKLTCDFEEKRIREPVDMFSWTIRFPAELKLQHPPEFEVFDGPTGKRHNWLTKVLQPHFYYSDALHIASLSIPKPPADYLYRISWYIPSREESGRRVELKDKLAVDEFTRELLRLQSQALVGGVPEASLIGVRKILDTFAHLVARKIDEEIKHPGKVNVQELDVSLMVYDDTQKKQPPKLRVVACRGSQSKEYMDFAVEVGDGVAGRVYKKNIVRSFDAKDQDERRQYYIAVPGYPVHEMLYSVPLRHPVSQELIFAVLNLGSFSPAEAGLLRLLNDENGFRWLLGQAQEYVLKRLLEELKIEC